MNTAIALTIEGPLTVGTVESWRVRLLTALEGAGALDLDLAAVSDVDAFGLQLLCASRRSAAAGNKSLRLVNTAGAFERACELAGLAPAEFSAAANLLP